ncbi:MULTISPECIES: Zn-dependent hydrolase [unclassified Variovorax]|uniref:Zn-dependent hydrolase n=1 Tax=unclassified Variovorax TaxID=663243 RepID=UPI002577B0C4|nr:MULTISPECIES: Zn-dependent hydrolase [unclassified Variovorax]MDM0091515.1 Zn-dependent hydrolase [Variovorax sp. J22G40]MDM0148718.1 Zn-dependent hydrolase [Variovorax sp. J2P1-31]
MSTTVRSALHFNADRFLTDLRSLGAIGADTEKGGRTRLALTDTEKQGRDFVKGLMIDLGLRVQVDRIGNLIGTLPSQNDSKPHLMMGSHIDTVRNAGALDGCYGVLGGLAVCRAYRDAGVLPERPLTVIAFTGEEGVRYHPDMLGSLVYAGGMSLEEGLASRGIDGTVLGDELRRIGYNGTAPVGAIVPAEYIELHIEQGPVLEAEGLTIGAVFGVQGISWQRITINGTANHAGTTPTRLRRDAGLAAAKVIAFMREEVANGSGGTTIAATGSIAFEPNLVNVIPRKAVFTADIRDPDETKLQEAEHKLLAFLEQLRETDGIDFSTESLARFEPVKFDESIVSLVAQTAQELGLPAMRMVSGAGHDAQMIARIAPAAMIFVPSAGGVSHNPREHTDDQDLIHGLRVLLRVVQRRLESPSCE